MNWNSLERPDQLKEIINESADTNILIFKHSTRCSISRTALDRLERNWKPEELGNPDFYFLDLLSYRAVSNAIEQVLDVEHESPQLIIVDKGKAIFHRSHLAIDYHQLPDVFRN